jgi:hypothetical protein
VRAVRTVGTRYSDRAQKRGFWAGMAGWGIARKHTGITYNANLRTASKRLPSARETKPTLVSHRYRTCPTRYRRGTTAVDADPRDARGSGPTLPRATRSTPPPDERARYAPRPPTPGAARGTRASPCSVPVFGSAHQSARPTVQGQVTPRHRRLDTGWNDSFAWLVARGGPSRHDERVPAATRS